MNKPRYEIGSVYRYNSDLFLALSDGLLLTFKKGKPVRRKPTTQYKRVKAVTVEQLCSKWGIHSDVLDQHTSALFTPRSSRTAPAGNSRRRGEEADRDYYELRRVRILRS